MMKHTVSVRVEEALLRKAQASLKTKSKSATVRKALEVVAEQEEFRRWVKKYAGVAEAEDFKTT